VASTTSDRNGAASTFLGTPRASGPYLDPRDEGYDRRNTRRRPDPLLRATISRYLPAHRRAPASCGVYEPAKADPTADAVPHDYARSSRAKPVPVLDRFTGDAYTSGWPIWRNASRRAAQTKLAFGDAIQRRLHPRRSADRVAPGPSAPPRLAESTVEVAPVYESVTSLLVPIKQGASGAGLRVVDPRADGMSSRSNG